jgi:hypothetical protein
MKSRIEITKRVKPTNKVMMAWKIIKVARKSRWHPWVFSKHTYKLGRWEKAHHPAYGFQAFLKERDAKHIPLMRNEKLVRVLMRRVEGYGRNLMGLRVVLAREIYVPKVETAHVR